MEVSEDKSRRALEEENCDSSAGGQPGCVDSHSQGGQREKVVSPSARRGAVNDECARRRLESGRSVSGARNLEIKLLSPRGDRAWRIALSARKGLELAQSSLSTAIDELPG